jgi:hypothetical protein
MGGNKATYPKGVATWPPVWKFIDRYSIPSLVILFTPRNGVGIENRVPVDGEKRPMCECFNIASKPLSI